MSRTGRRSDFVRRDYCRELLSRAGREARRDAMQAGPARPAGIALYSALRGYAEMTSGARSIGSCTATSA